MSEFIKHILSKMTSGRLIATVLITGTFCIVVLYALHLFNKNLSTDKLPVIKEVLMFILGAFTTQAGNVITSYFDRSDRKPEGEQK